MAKRKTPPLFRKHDVNFTVPAGFKPVRGTQFAPKWDMDALPELAGTVELMKTAITGKGKRKRTTAVMEVVDSDGQVHTVWSSAALEGVFKEAQVGDSIVLQFHGRKKIPGQQQPMKLIEAFLRHNDTKVRRRSRTTKKVKRG